MLKTCWSLLELKEVVPNLNGSLVENILKTILENESVWIITGDNLITSLIRSSVTRLHCAPRDDLVSMDSQSIANSSQSEYVCIVSRKKVHSGNSDSINCKTIYLLC